MAEENKYLRSLNQNAQNGRIVALEELYEINLNRVYAVIRRLVGNKSLAEIITKNTLIDGWEKITESGTGEMSFAEWFKNIAVVNTLNELKDLSLSKNKKKRTLLEKDSHTDYYSSNPLEKIIADLEVEKRMIFVLNQIEGLSISETSGYVEIPESDVESKLAETTEQIAEALASVNPDAKLDTEVENLQREIEPDEDILVSALDEIKEIRFAIIKKEEDERIKTEETFEIEEDTPPVKKEKKIEEKKEKEIKIDRQPFAFNKRIIFPVLLFILAIAIIFLIPFSIEWQIISTTGMPRINESTIKLNATLSNDDIITTDGLSTAIIEIHEVGKIELLNSTTFKRLKGDFSGELMRGKSIIQADKGTESLSISVPKATIENFTTGTNYSAMVDERGNSVIELKGGWLSILSGDYELLLPPGHQVNVYKEAGVSIPHNSESSFEYVTRLEEYLFGGKRTTTLNQVLSLSTYRESVTLWDLLRRVNPEQREAVYNKLYELIPHPESVIKEDILNLKPDELQLWLGEIKKLP